MGILDTTQPFRQAPSGPSPSECGRVAAAAIVLPVIRSWESQRRFISQATVGFQANLLARLAEVDK